MNINTNLSNYEYMGWDAMLIYTCVGYVNCILYHALMTHNSGDSKERTLFKILSIAIKKKSICMKQEKF